MATQRVSSQLLQSNSLFTTSSHRLSRCPVIQLLLALAFILSSFFIALAPDNANAGQVTLAWDMNSEPNITGYKVYYGTASRNYDWFIDVGNVTQVTITDIPNGATYYFAATAYDNSNPPNESTYSDEVNKNMCTYSISPTNDSFGPSGGTGSVSVTTQAGCAWTASSSASWISITSGNSGVGNGTINYSVSANTDPDSQTASSTFAGKVFTVTQSGAQTYTITASAGTGGTITPSGATTVAHGTSQTFNITASAGYQILNVAVDGASIGAVSSYTFSNITAGHTINATFSIKTYTINASAGTGGSISPSGNTTANYGTNQAFTIIPSAGYSIEDVTVDGVPQGAIGSYTFTNVTANHTISALFKANSFTINSSAGTGGAISPSGNIVVQNGGSQTLTIVPDSGYVISDVLVDGSSVGAVSSFTFRNITANHTINASFVLGYSLTVNTSGNGSGHVIATPSATVYAPGTKITLKAIAGETSNFDGFSGDCTSKKTKCTFIMNQHSEINAAFELKNFRVVTTAVGNGTISIEGTASIKNKKVRNVAKIKRSKHYVTIDYGSKLAYHIKPEPGHYIKKVLVNGKRIETVDTLTFVGIKRNHHVKVRFESESALISQVPLNTVGKKIVFHDDEDHDPAKERADNSGENDNDRPIEPSSAEHYASLKQ
jgi:hypothetical protein